jgi:hypothetical protein
MPWLIDTPPPFACKAELEAFLAKMRQLPQDRSVQSAIGIVEDYLKQAEEYERRKVLKAEGTKPDATG